MDFKNIPSDYRGFNGAIVVETHFKLFLLWAVRARAINLASDTLKS